MYACDSYSVGGGTLISVRLSIISGNLYGGTGLSARSELERS
jgi:hypothetical protein